MINRQAAAATVSVIILLLEGIGLLDYALNSENYHFGTEVGGFEYRDRVIYFAFHMATFSLAILGLVFQRRSLGLWFAGMSLAMTFMRVF